MAVILNKNTCIEGVMTLAVQKAADILKRDMGNVFNDGNENGSGIRLIADKMEKEQYYLRSRGGNLEIHAGDDLGFVYGIYEISRKLLGITDFWFWNDQDFTRKDEILVPDDFRYHSHPFRVKYRGWFVNDEVLISKWCIEGNYEKPWELLFETILRCGGNMVIPGTDRNSQRYRKMASEMGLWITHHHAEPLGAEMFARAYPELHPSYQEYSEKFKDLWEKAIEDQKGMKIIWNLGFRGQGDCPFWANDPAYDTDKSRGKLISDLIRIQYDMVKESNLEAVCCTNLYGETMELYQKGFLNLPEDVIHIWADNGFGKMVSRRQNNHNPRIRSLPDSGEEGHHGIYYHVSFYDLQAANHITMLPNSLNFVKQELSYVTNCGIKDFWIINCSNVKPHIFFLSFIAKMWKHEEVEEHRWIQEFVNRYYGNEHADLVAECFLDFAKAALPYGKEEDEHAGEQFAHYVARSLMTQFMKNSTHRAEELLWATSEPDLTGQVARYRELCSQAVLPYKKYRDRCQCTAKLLNASACCLFEDTLLLQADILFYSYQGACYVCESLKHGFAGEYLSAFYYAGAAREAYLKGDKSMRAREHGKWKNFYQNECLTDVKQSGWLAGLLMGYFRVLGDGPHFYVWQREYLYSPEDRRVMLLTNMENHLNDFELYELMKARWEEQADAAISEESGEETGR